MSPATQITPDYLAQDKSSTLWNAAITFTMLETLFMALFMISRFTNKTKRGLEMYFLPIGYVWNIGLCVMTFCIVKYGGAGKHLIAVAEEDFEKIIVWLKIEVAAEFAYVLGVTFPKLAILSLYMRIFSTAKYRKFTYFIGAVLITNAVALCMLSATICQPFAFNWNKTIPHGHCGNLMLGYKLASFPNILTDLIMLILPLPVVWNLHTGRAQKIGLTITFLTGSIGIVTSIVRLVTFFTTDLFADPTYNSVRTLTWTVVEPGTYLIAATLPSLRPLSQSVIKSTTFISIRSRLTSSFSRGSSLDSRAAQLSGVSSKKKHVLGSSDSGDCVTLTASSLNSSHNYHAKESYGSSGVYDGKKGAYVSTAEYRP